MSLSIFSRVCPAQTRKQKAFLQSLHSPFTTRWNLIDFKAFMHSTIPTSCNTMWARRVARWKRHCSSNFWLDHCGVIHVRCCWIELWRIHAVWNWLVWKCSGRWFVPRRYSYSLRSWWAELMECCCQILSRFPVLPICEKLDELLSVVLELVKVLPRAFSEPFHATYRIARIIDRGMHSANSLTSIRPSFLMRMNKWWLCWVDTIASNLNQPLSWMFSQIIEVLFHTICPHLQREFSEYGGGEGEFSKWINTQITTSIKGNENMRRVET